jgi:hypothetical protein
MRSVPSVLFLALAASACATAPATHSEWRGVNGWPVNPAEYQKAFVECRGDAAAVAANSPQPAVPNIYLLAAAQGQRNQTLDAVMQGCMSKRGYVFVQVPNAPQ